LEATATVDDDALSFLLSLVARELVARNSPLWKTDVEAAADEHCEACEAVWSELYRMLDKIPVEAAKPARPELIKRALKRDMKKALKAALSNTVDQLVDDL
jgi:hypothetical protein